MERIKKLGFRILPWLKFNVPHFVAETIGWDDAKKGAYITLICYQWMNGKIPPPERLHEISPTAAERWDEFADKFEPTGNQLDWIEEQREEANRISDARRRGGRSRAKQIAEEKRRRKQDHDD